jgi:gluconokinase
MFKGAAVVMGVTSCGKTTLGEALAKALQVKFVEGDRLHPPANIAKMSSGQPLDDEDRWPWLSTIGESLRGSEGIIASCSSLKKSYRDLIVARAGRPVMFIHLDGPRCVLAARIAARKGHFMPPSLLDSQLATLERPGVGENFITVPISVALKDQVAQASQALLAWKP